MRCCWQHPGLVALWCDNGSVRVLNVDEQLKQLAAETEVLSKAASKTQVCGHVQFSWGGVVFGAWWGRGWRKGSWVCEQQVP